MTVTLQSPLLFGWEIIKSFPADGSSRRYHRVVKNKATAILMDCSGPQSAGHNIENFIRIDEWIRSIGLKAPEIYEQDVIAGFLLVEDFGDVSFKSASQSGIATETLYGLGRDILEALNAVPCPLDLPRYYESHLHAGHRRVLDWYAPLALGRKNPDDWTERYLNIWSDIESSLPACREGFLHIDFHAENLIWLEHQKGLNRCGILDFQGAMFGPLPYDFGNFLEDARMDIGKQARENILRPYDPNFAIWYRVLATQFHCRVIGQFVKLALRHNQTKYLDLIPRVEVYIKDGLQDPILAPLRSFFLEIGLDFHSPNGFNAPMNEDFIGSDAF